MSDSVSWYVQQVEISHSGQTSSEQAAQASTVAQAVQVGTGQSFNSVFAGISRTATTPLASVLQADLGQTIPPRSREDIRKLFTRRSTPLQPASSQQVSANFHQDPPCYPLSRLQQHRSTAPHQSGLPATAVHQQTCAPAQHNSSLHQNQHASAVQHQAPNAPAGGGTVPAGFGQYAYPGSKLPTISNHQGQTSSGQSHQQSQQTSLQHKSGAVNSVQAGASAVPRASVNSGPGPSMRAEILMGPAATIEVNVRFHANIAAALKRYVCVIHIHVEISLCRKQCTC